MKAESHRHNVLFTHPSLAAEPATPQPQFSIVGEKGAGNLDAVDKGERIKNRDIAEEMEREGKSARAIRLATGWERGADGKWRYEMPDGDLLIPVAAILQGSDNTTLEQIWRDQQLFSAYPQLRGVPVRVVNEPFGSMASAVITRRQETPEYTHAENFVNSFDHYIPELEERISRYEMKLDKAKAEGNTEFADDLQMAIANIRERIAEAPSRKEHAEWVLANPTDIVSRELHLNKSYMDSENARDLIAHELQHFIQEEEGFASGDSPAREENGTAIGYDNYRRSAGETEARNVQERLNYTDQQRRDTTLAETEDVPRDQQIVMFGDGVSMSTVEDDILNYFHKAVRGEVTGHGKSVGKLTKEGKQYLEQVSGLTLKEDIDFVLKPSDLRHIYREHYGSNEKDPGNNKPLTDDDIRNIATVCTQPERVIF